MPPWLKERLPDWLVGPLGWVFHPAGLIAISVVSLMLFVLSIVGVPWYLARMPADYFSKREQRSLHMVSTPRSPARWAALIGKNALGYTLIAAGFAMLVLPGQGLLTIVAGLFLVDFPGKRRLERAIIASAPVYRAINALRKRAGRPPLERGSWI